MLRFHRLFQYNHDYIRNYLRSYWTTWFHFNDNILGSDDQSWVLIRDIFITNLNHFMQDVIFLLKDVNPFNTLSMGTWDSHKKSFKYNSSQS